MFFVLQFEIKHDEKEYILSVEVSMMAMTNLGSLKDFSSGLTSRLLNLWAPPRVRNLDFRQME